MHSRFAPSVTPGTFRILLGRINSASGKPALETLEKTITRHYDNGTLTAPELSRLDTRIMERLAAIQP